MSDDVDHLTRDLLDASAPPLRRAEAARALWKRRAGREALLAAPDVDVEVTVAVLDDFEFDEAWFFAEPLFDAQRFRDAWTFSRHAGAHLRQRINGRRRRLTAAARGRRRLRRAADAGIAIGARRLINRLSRVSALRGRHLRTLQQLKLDRPGRRHRVIAHRLEVIDPHLGVVLGRSVIVGNVEAEVVLSLREKLGRRVILALRRLRLLALLILILLALLCSHLRHFALADHGVVGHGNLLKRLERVRHDGVWIDIAERRLRLGRLLRRHLLAGHAREQGLEILRLTPTLLLRTLQIARNAAALFSLFADCGAQIVVPLTQLFSAKRRLLRRRRLAGRDARLSGRLRGRRAGGRAKRR